jgi:hypothetical protein
LRQAAEKAGQDLFKKEDVWFQTEKGKAAKYLLLTVA